MELLKNDVELLDDRLNVIEDSLEQPRPKQILVLALAKNAKGRRAKIMADALHNRHPEEYNEPLVKYFHDVPWRECVKKIRKITKKWEHVSPCAVFVDKEYIGDDDDFQIYLSETTFLLAGLFKTKYFSNMDILERVRKKDSKTYVFFEIEINYKNIGKMIFEIDSDTMPKATNEFLELCCWQDRFLPPGMTRRTAFHNASFRRIVPGCWIEAGIQGILYNVDIGHESPTRSHDRRGVISLNRSNEGLVCSHFIVTLDKSIWMDHKYRAIGHLIDGEPVLHMIEQVKTVYEKPKVDILIADCGILYSPTFMTTSSFQNDTSLGGRLAKQLREEMHQEALRQVTRSDKLISTNYGTNKIQRDSGVEFTYIVPKQHVVNRATTDVVDGVSYVGHLRGVRYPALWHQTDAEGIQEDSNVQSKNDPPDTEELVEEADSKAAWNQANFKCQDVDSLHEADPFEAVKQDEQYHYSQFSTKIMNQVTPKLLLAWAKGLDEGYTVKSIQENILKLLNTAVPDEDVIHPLDSTSIDLFPERYIECLYSLPSQLLQLLKESLEETIKDQNLPKVQPHQRSLSEDVVSGCMFSLIEFSTRLIQSTDDLVSNMDNLDFVVDMIDKVILRKVVEFEREEDNEHLEEDGEHGDEFVPEKVIQVTDFNSPSNISSLPETGSILNKRNISP